MADYLTIEEVAPLLKMKPQGLYRAIREKQFPFPFIKIGKQIRVPRTALEGTNAASGDAEKK